MHSLNKALIVGTGFGSLYKKIYEDMNVQVTTVDIADPNADYKHVYKALDAGLAHWDVCHITTPNHTHYPLADLCANFCDIVFVEKPGVEDPELWEELLADHPNTRIMMTKNNQYRDNVHQIREAAQQGEVRINWINNNRVPKPGSWFTNKKLAFGGVSRDLMPHLLSWVQVLDDAWLYSKPKWTRSDQRWKLADLAGSDYGDVDPNGVYDVDDSCYVALHRFNLHADWRSMTGDDIAIHTDKVSFQLGLCPESAYEAMIRIAHENLNNDEFWNKQKDMDLWIHRILQSL
jgi:predicted dehydrogenase